MALKVSIIVPVYNVEKYIERCAVSVFEQTYDNIECIFVNDCTKDDSIQVLKQVLMRYPLRQKNTLIINHDVNRGLAAARNTGVSHCTGDFILHVDSDDYLVLNSVELLVNQQLSSNSDLITGMILKHTNDKQIVLPHPHYRTKEEMVLDMMQHTINHSLCKRLIRKSLYDDYNISAEEGVNCGEDCWVMTRLAYYASSFSFVDVVVYHYDCTRDDSYMSYNKSKINYRKVKDDIATSNLIIDFFKDKEQVYYDEANRVAIRYLNYILTKAAKVGDSELFDEMKSRIASFDKKYRPAIDWNKGYKRLMSQNIHSCRFMVAGINLYSNILSHIK